jgi:hypothetical protein
MAITIDVPMLHNVEIAYGELVNFHFTVAGRVTNSSDPATFNPPLANGHYDANSTSAGHVADNGAHDDIIIFVPDHGPQTMKTIHVQNIGIDRELLSAKDVVASAQGLITFVVNTLRSNAPEIADDQSRFFFPGGINSISVGVTGPIGIQVAVSGPATSSGSGLAETADK